MRILVAVAAVLLSPSLTRAQISAPLRGGLASHLALSAAPAPSLPHLEPHLAMPRDRGRGAAYGLLIGAGIGAVGFSAATYLGNRGQPEGNGYVILALPVGAVVGGAIGGVLGVIVGWPKSHIRGVSFIAAQPGAAVDEGRR